MERSSPTVAARTFIEGSSLKLSVAQRWSARPYSSRTNFHWRFKSHITGGPEMERPSLQQPHELSLKVQVSHYGWPRDGAPVPTAAARTFIEGSSLKFSVAQRWSARPYSSRTNFHWRFKSQTLGGPNMERPVPTVAARTFIEGSSLKLSVVQRWSARPYSSRTNFHWRFKSRTTGGWVRGLIFSVPPVRWGLFHNYGEKTWNHVVINGLCERNIQIRFSLFGGDL